MPTVKYFTKKQLVDANKAAIRLRLNRSLNVGFLNSLSEDDVYPVNRVHMHNDDCLRLEVVLNEAGTCGVLDVSYETFENLAGVDAPADLAHIQ